MKKLLSVALLVVAMGATAQTKRTVPWFEIVRNDSGGYQTLVKCDGEFKSCKLGDGVTLEDLVRTVRDIVNDDSAECHQRVEHVLDAWKSSLPKTVQQVKP